MPETASFDIKQLYEIQEKKNQIKYTTYENIIRRIHHQVVAVSQRGDTKLMYRIPTFVMGIPTYKPIDCVNYVLRRLNDEGFIVQYIHPNTILLDWKMNTTPTHPLSTTTVAPSVVQSSPSSQQRLNYQATGKLFH